jgi:UDP:flavonoid glycosyltransferase YjiC (YdhE family)
LSRVLFISGSVGLGHVTRDVAICGQLRKTRPDVEVHWMAQEPAVNILEEMGEYVLPESSELANETEIAEDTARGPSLNLVSYQSKTRKHWASNKEVYRRATTRQEYDLVVGDETYDLIYALNMDRSLKRWPFAMIWDFVGMYSSGGLRDRLSAYLENLIWSMDGWLGGADDLSIFVGVPEDVPDERFGFLLPNKRCYAQRRYKFVGYILGFSPEDNLDQASAKHELGYGEKQLIVCSAGGTGVGRELLDKCVEAHRILKGKLDADMHIVCGPRIDPETIDAPEGVKVSGYVRNLYRHFAASDIAVVQGGGTTTLELAALRRPFIYFPLEGHFEQERHVSGRLNRIGAGVRLRHSDTSADDLADAIMSNIGRTVDYGEVPCRGAEATAKLLAHLLD